MATIRFSQTGALEAVCIDGVDITKHVLAEPVPKVVVTGNGPHDVYAVDLRLILGPDSSAPSRRLCDPGGGDGSTYSEQIRKQTAALQEMVNELRDRNKRGAGNASRNRKV